MSQVQAQTVEMPRPIHIALVVAAAVFAPLASPTQLSVPVDLNRASLAELQHLPGMTATWAARIVRFRPYRTKRDLIDHGVVTAEVYRRIRDRVVAHRDTVKK